MPSQRRSERIPLDETMREKIIRLYTDRDCPMTVRALAQRFLSTPAFIARILDEAGVYQSRQAKRTMEAA